METLIVCLFIASLMPIISKTPLMLEMKKQSGGYDNQTPRDQQAKLKGLGARALAAHQNSFESLIFFATAALTALSTHHNSPLIQSLAVFYIITRLAYHSFYLLNWSTLRSIAWSLGYLSCLTIILVCL